MEILMYCMILFCVLYGFTSLVKNQNIEHKDIWFVTLSFLVLFLIHFSVDINSVEDLPSYEQKYNEMTNMSFIDAVTNSRTTEYVYYSIVYVFSHLKLDFRSFLFFYNAILFLSFYWMIKKYSVDRSFSILMFLMIVYCQSIFVIRQYLSLSLLLLTIPLILNRRLIPYLIVVLTACFIHHTAIIWVPLFFIMSINNKKAFILTLLLVSGVFIVLSENFGQYLMLIETDYSLYLLQDGASRNITKVLIQIMYLFTYVFFLKSDIFKNGINRLITTGLVILTVGYVFAPSINLLDRMMQYYQTFIILSIPLTASYIRELFIREIFILLTIGLQCYVSIQPLHQDYYRFFSISEQQGIYYLLTILLAYILVKYVYNKELNNENINLELP